MNYNIVRAAAAHAAAPVFTPRKPSAAFRTAEMSPAGSPDPRPCRVDGSALAAFGTVLIAATLLLGAIASVLFVIGAMK
jgi:hypothetical protein